MQNQPAPSNVFRLQKGWVQTKDLPKDLCIQKSVFIFHFGIISKQRKLLSSRNKNKLCVMSPTNSEMEFLSSTWSSVSARIFFTFLIASFLEDACTSGSSNVTRRTIFVGAWSPAWIVTCIFSIGASVGTEIAWQLVLLLLLATEWENKPISP